jgi:hypothetical protein
VIDPATFPLGTLRTLLARLIPADDFPGAIEAGTTEYILRQLAGDCAHEAPFLDAGLRQLEAEVAAREAGLTFATLEASRQDALLREIEQGRSLTSWSSEMPAAAFFARMVDLAHEGYYADPANRGNRDAVSWRMIGYDPRLPPSLTKSGPP